MCGLILAPDRYSESAVRAAMFRMDYRGKDGLSGLVSTGGWRLGHVRLAIQDLSDQAAQPFVDRGGYTAFVGEFFSSGGLSEQDYLSQLLTQEDFSKVDGFWALARIAGTEAFVCTDHLGIKPLYIWPKHQIVCSELAPMFALEPAPAFDKTYLSNCIKFGYDFSGRTPYQGIWQVAPGTKVGWTHGASGLSSYRYWDWDAVPGAPEDLKALVDQSICNRLISDRPVALLLSGGLDSSIIYYSLLAAGKSIQAFSVENGESEFLPAGVTPLPLAKIGSSEALFIMQAPLDLGSLVPQIQLARAVSQQGYNVVMTGDGADELFGGYRRAAEYDSQYSDTFCELPYYHLPRLDRVMMRSTIELRSPFLAPSVVAAALRTPRSERTAKQALKRAYQGVVPDRILAREKHPLKTPAVIQGGLSYRQQLVEEFCCVSSRF